MNIITNAAHIKNTKKFFKHKYEGKGKTPYQLGSLCMDWDRRVGKNIPDPPWANDADNPWDQDDASDWRAHCLTDLGNINEGSADGGTPSGKSVKEDLEGWIRDAILNEMHIKYKYQPKRKGTKWRADLITKYDPNNRKRIRIKVKGPGF